jgi:hypothetical protein
VVPAARVWFTGQLKVVAVLEQLPAVATAVHGHVNQADVDRLATDRLQGHPGRHGHRHGVSRYQLAS